MNEFKNKSDRPLAHSFSAPGKGFSQSISPKAGDVTAAASDTGKSKKKSNSRDHPVHPTSLKKGI
eukprot:5731116-Amphidinium_carterae.1